MKHVVLRRGNETNEEETVNHRQYELEEEVFVRLHWEGAFSYGENGLDESRLDRFGPR